jgi:dipeptidyl aminopeptidase/acylaminoacyl peptidase
VDFGEPNLVTSLPAVFTAPCPGSFTRAQEAREAIAPEDLSSYDAEQHVVTGEWVEFESVDGLVIPAYLARPVSGGPYPGVVWAHGGFFNQTDPAVIETIASGGFVALGVDYRGSSGHSQELRLAVDIAGKEVDDLVAGSEFLRTRAEVVPDRIAVAGGSHGAALALTATYRFPDTFAAAADFYGPSDWACISTQFTRPGLPIQLIQYSFGGAPDEVPGEYKARSAYYNANAIDVPLYVAHGTRDSGIPPGESLKLVKLLRRRGAEVTSRFFLDERHGFIQAAPRSSPLWGDFFRFLDKYLKD